VIDYEPFIALGVALGVGLLIGLQREQSGGEAARTEQSFLGGVRTYPLYALCGSVSMMIGAQAGYWIVGVVLTVLTIPLAIAYYIDIQTNKDAGVTSEAALILTFLLGVLAMCDMVLQPQGTRLLVVGAVGVLATALLSLKVPLHEFVSRISRDDIFSALKFLILAVIILPLLPNERMGPLNELNPFNIGLMIVLMAGMGIAGYVLIRVMGTGRGLGLTGLVGGMVSSTAVTLAFSARARREPAVAGACALGVVLASAVMLVRVLVEVAAVHPPLLRSVIWPIGGMMLAALVSAALLYLRESKASRDASTESASGDEQNEVKLRNPFELGLAIKFGLLFALILLLTKAASIYLGQSGLYLTAVIAGLTDIDAITLSMARLARDGTDPGVASMCILLGCASNTLVKATLAATLGGAAFGRILIPAFLAMLAGGALALAAFRMFAQ